MQLSHNGNTLIIKKYFHYTAHAGNDWDQRIVWCTLIQGIHFEISAEPLRLVPPPLRERIGYRMGRVIHTGSLWEQS